MSVIMNTDDSNASLLISNQKLTASFSSKFESNTDKDKEYIKEMTQLKEENMLQKGLLYVMLPSSILGIVGCYFPYVYAMLPGNAVDLCTCSFFEAYVHKTRNFVILNSLKSYPVLQILNSLTTMSWQFCINICLMTMVYKIRHIQDDTLIKFECITIVFLLIFIELVLYGIYIFGQSD